jgi:hypothetical protein
MSRFEHAIEKICVSDAGPLPRSLMRRAQALGIPDPARLSSLLTMACCNQDLSSITIHLFPLIITNK